MTVQLDERLVESEAKLNTFRQERGAAILDGKKPDHRKIANLNAEIDAVRDAEAEQARRDRQKAAEAREARLKGLRADLAGYEAERLKALEVAENSARKVVKAITEAMNANAKVCTTVHEITGRKVPSELNETELRGRLSRRLSAIMGQLPGPIGYFGDIRWKSGFFTPEQTWKDAEEALAKPHLSSITTKKEK